MSFREGAGVGVYLTADFAVLPAYSGTWPCLHFYIPPARGTEQPLRICLVVLHSCHQLHLTSCKSFHLLRFVGHCKRLYHSHFHGSDLASVVFHLVHHLWCSSPDGFIWHSSPWQTLISSAASFLIIRDCGNSCVPANQDQFMQFK